MMKNRWLVPFLSENVPQRRLAALGEDQAMKLGIRSIARALDRYHRRPVRAVRLDVGVVLNGLSVTD